MARNDKSVLVLGGGLAGITVALELAGQGVRVALADKDDFLGGVAARLTCKALESCQKCNGCLAEPRLGAVLDHPGITLWRRSRVAEVARQERGFKVALTQGPAYIDPRRCTGCGLCLEVCPAAEAGALRPPLIAGDRPRLAIGQEACLYFKDQRSTLCRDTCPEEAIDFQQVPRRVELEVDALVLATGFAPYPAGQKERLGHGRVPDVVTALELEESLRRLGRPARPSDGQTPKKVAFIQCVGSRERLGHNYCSRVCCGYALRLGRHLHERHGAAVSIFYMDLQSFGHAMDDFLAAAQSELNLVRSMPYDVYRGRDGGAVLEYQALSGQAPVQGAFDLVVLSVGMAPNPDNPALAQACGLSLDGHGFLDPGPGIFVTGAAGGPLDMAEVVAQAGAAAQEALSYLEAC
ncbi:MAG: FAD-dependent oxidoreductase [Pseudomonadota bacterium]